MNKKDRIPPNQKITSKLPVLHIGSIPRFNPEKWNFKVFGLVETPLKLTYKDFIALPKIVSTSDFHCVTGWSRLDNLWEGVLFKKITDLVKPLDSARYVSFIAEGNYTSSLPLKDLMYDDVLLAYKLDGKPLEPKHGGPLRLVVPKKYAYKSVKWVRELNFTKNCKLGYWEKRGYSNSADPWKEERYKE
jgi:DMSO/TMAO reductase YedYZ molybdopterin-dependent catalytic subunit